MGGTAARLARRTRALAQAVHRTGRTRCRARPHGRISRMRGQHRKLTGQPLLAQLGQPVVPGLAHQLGQLGRGRRRTPARPRRAPRSPTCTTSAGRGRPAPSRGGRTHRSTPGARACRRAGRSTRTSAGPATASTRPAWSPAARGPPAAPGCAASSRRRRRSRAGSGRCDHPWNGRVWRESSSSSDTQPFTVPSAWCCRNVRGEPGHVPGDPPLVVLVGEVRAQRAAAVVRAGRPGCPGSRCRRCSSSERSARSDRSGRPARRRPGPGTPPTRARSRAPSHHPSRGSGRFRPSSPSLPFLAGFSSFAFFVFGTRPG
ncbi:hypothetical protein SFUMM280S_10852 [Streptomyces fumanus]